MNILYFGDNKPHSTSFHRASALKRLGHYVEILNPYGELKYILFNSLINKLHFHTGYIFVENKINYTDCKYLA